MAEIKSIDKNEALRYLGYGGKSPDETIRQLIDTCEAELLKAIQPRFLYRCFDIEKTKSGILLDNTNLLLTGKDIENHLSGCNKAVLLCATISSGADRLIRVAQLNDMTKAVILDSLASVAVEQICNQAEKEIKKQFSEYFQTWRYSPGYGDFPIEIQKDFLDVLNAPKTIGLMATESSILTPRKSVTAVIGLSADEILQKKRGCQTCRLRETCAFRKRGERCEF